MAKNRGLMLIDLLMAVVIVGITAVAAIEILTASVQAGRRAQNLHTATSLCRSSLEEIRNVPDLLPGAGSNVGDPFLPDLTGVAVRDYFPGFFLTESDTYQASDGTPGSLAGTMLAGRVDRITRVEWVNDPTGGGIEDYFKVTVTVYWQEGGATQSVSLETLVSAY